jgi:hypothetical protein
MMSPYGPQNLPYPQLRDEMQLSMRRLVREGRLPHDLLDQYWFRGRFEHLGPHEIRLSRGTDYFPVDALATPEGVPETLAKKDYSPARVAELFERWKRHLHEINQKRVAAGKKPQDIVYRPCGACANCMRPWDTVAVKKWLISASCTGALFTAWSGRMLTTWIR